MKLVIGPSAFPSDTFRLIPTVDRVVRVTRQIERDPSARDNDANYFITARLEVIIL